MIKYYCDVCGKELTRDYVEDRLVRELDRVKVEVTVAIDGTWNKGDICGDCLIKAISKGKDIKF